MTDFPLCVTKLELFRCILKSDGGDSIDDVLIGSRGWLTSLCILEVLKVSENCSSSFLLPTFVTIPFKFHFVLCAAASSHECW